MRDLKELMKESKRPLTRDEIDHFDEYMSFKNHSKPMKDVSISETVAEVITDFDYYLGFKKEKRK
ncbi:hypothetical protein R80B4_00074 [Fibrobacteres bacterium R8-0-B4]